MHSSSLKSSHILEHCDVIIISATLVFLDSTDIALQFKEGLLVSGPDSF